MNDLKYRLKFPKTLLYKAVNLEYDQMLSFKVYTNDCETFELVMLFVEEDLLELGIRGSE